MKIPVLFAAILLIISCKKNDAPALETEKPLPTAKLKQVSLWLGFSDTIDTLQPANYLDTIYYNTNNQIEKIRSTAVYLGNYVVEYNITYNNAGKISRITSNAVPEDTANDVDRADYTFIYNTAGKLDSLKAYQYPSYTSYNTFKYNANGDLSDIYSYAPSYMRSHSTYGWNSNRKLDSIHIETFAPENATTPANTHTFTFTSANNVTTSLDKTYLLTVALREERSFDFSSRYGEIMVLHQFVNPDVNLLGNGMEILDYPQVNQHFVVPYSHVLNLSPNNQVRSITPNYFFGNVQTVYPRNTQRFEYL